MNSSYDAKIIAKIDILFQNETNEMDELYGDLRYTISINRPRSFPRVVLPSFSEQLALETSQVLEGCPFRRETSRKEKKKKKKEKETFVETLVPRRSFCKTNNPALGEGERGSAGPTFEKGRQRSQRERPLYPIN